MKYTENGSWSFYSFENSEQFRFYNLQDVGIVHLLSQEEGETRWWGFLVERPNRKYWLSNSSQMGPLIVLDEEGDDMLFGQFCY